jgi:hypothetical protein
LDVGLKPPARQRTLDILSSVLDDGHELSEDEMVELFTARGADFDAVCSAAGAFQDHIPWPYHIIYPGFLPVSLLPQIRVKIVPSN